MNGRRCVRVLLALLLVLAGAAPAEESDARAELRALNERGKLHLQLREPEAAAACFRDALALLPPLALERSVEHASLLTSLGAATGMPGTNEAAREALALHREALSILEQLPAPPPLELAAVLSNLGGTLLVLGERAEAGACLERAVEVSRENGGIVHAKALNQLGSMRLLEGDLQSAQDCIEQAYTLVGKRPAYWGEGVEFLGNLALCAYLLDNDAYLYGALGSALTLAERTYLLDRLPRSDEAGMRRLVGARGYTDSLVYSAVFGEPDMSADAARTGALAALNLKGIVLDALALRAAHSQGDSPQQSMGAAHEADMAILDTVRDRLAPDDVLLEFVRYWHRELRTLISPEPDPGHARYACFVIRRDMPPVAIDLGAAQRIEDTVKAYRQVVENSRPPNMNKPRRDAGRHALELYRLTLEKVIVQAGIGLGASRRLIVAPDGALLLVPFEAMVVADEGFETGARVPLRYLATEYPQLSISYVNSARDVRNWNAGEREQPAASGGLLVGLPVFDFDEDAARGAAEALAARGIKAGEAGAVPAEALAAALGGQLDARGAWRRPWPYLQDSMEPFAAFKTAWPADAVFEGWQAMESVLQTQPAPPAVTLVTHGAFVPAERDEQLFGSGSFSLAQEDAAVIVHDPMMRSMLLFAGANDPPAMRSLGLEDGLLTAAELARLDLSETRLFAMIACETAKGNYETWVGVSGLRRALAQAGAEAVLGSMWEIPARTSPELYARFRENWLDKGMPKTDALREARLETLRAQQDLDPGGGHPWYWAGLVLIGDPG